MNYASCMTVCHGIHYLLENSPCFNLWQALSILYILQEFSSSRVLHYHAELLALNEGIVEGYNVLVDDLL